MKITRQALIDGSVPAGIYLVTGIVFLPVIHWLLGQTIAHEQLLHAFLVFLLSMSLLVYERRIALKPALQFTDTAQNLLIFAYALLVLAIFTRVNLVILAALSLSVASLLLYVFGSGQRRLIFSGIGAFTLFAAIAVVMPVLDWPLRGIAGRWSAYGLSLMGQHVELGLVPSAGGPMLMLFSNGRPFHVAAECNGFGMVSSSLLLSLIIVLYRKIPLLERAGWLLAALLVGLAFNAVRIILIVLLAPQLPEGSYMLMHETVGLLTTYGGLAALYFLLMPREAA